MTPLHLQPLETTMRNDSFVATRWTRLALSAVALASLAACANFSGISSQAKPIDSKAVGLSQTAIPAANPAYVCGPSFQSAR